MFEQFIANFTWLDICVLVLLARFGWVGFHKGVLVEVIKNISLFVAIFVGLHYYIRFGKKIINVLQVSEPVAHIFSYVLLVCASMLFFKLMHEGFLVLFKDEDDKCSTSSKIIGMVLGFWRAVLISGIIFFGCIIVDNAKLTGTVSRSLLAPILLPLNTKIYSETYDLFIDPFFPKEQKNLGVLKMTKENKRVFD